MKIRIVKPDAKICFCPESITPKGYGMQCHHKADTIEIDIDEMVKQWLEDGGWEFDKDEIICVKSFSQYLQEVIDGK